MGIFDSGYKQDALKWRAHKELEDRKKLESTSKGRVTFTLSNGDTIKVEVLTTGKMVDVGFLEYEGMALSSIQTLYRLFRDVEKETREVGLNHEDTYYPPSSIFKVEFEVLDG